MAQVGRIRLDTLVNIEIPLLLALPCYTYYMAVSKNEVPAYPFATITDTACPYPQNILFRFGMLTAASFLSLIFYCIFSWLHYIKQRIQYPHKISSWLYPVSQFAILTYAITIGTIDSNDIGNLHTPCAIIFFVILFVVTINVTVLISDMRQWDASVVTPQSWFFKKLTCIYLTALWSYCLYGILFNSKEVNKQNPYVVILEWNEVFVNLLWVFSFRSDWKKVYLTFNGAKIDSDPIQLVPGPNEYPDYPIEMLDQ